MFTRAPTSPPAGPAAANAASLEDLRSHTNARLPIIDEVLEEFDMLPGGRTDVGLAPTARDIITGEPTGRKQSGLKATSVTVEVQTRGRRRRNSPSDVSGTTAGWSPAPRGAIASLGGESVEWGGSWKPPLRPATSNLSTVSRASGRRRNLRSGASRAESSSSVTLEVARSWDPYRGLPIRREGGAFPSTRIFHG